MVLIDRSMMKIIVSCIPTIFNMHTLGGENDYNHTGCKPFMLMHPLPLASFMKRQLLEKICSKNTFPTSKVKVVHR